jgi:signal transduction histidine kinase
MKARFMAGITHELKTPLAVIRTHANNLTTYYKRLPPRKRKDLLEAIDRQVRLLERLVGEILELARLDAGISLQRQQADLVSIINDVIEELRPLALQKQLKVQWRRPRKPLLANVDVERMARVIRNLVDNAIKYTESGFIKVEAESTMQDGVSVIRIQVTDTGIGIPVDHIKRIFERFYRVDPSHTIPGTGLGLSIVKEIVDAHGGQIQVSRRPEGGSIFTITLKAG